MGRLAADGSDRPDLGSGEHMIEIDSKRRGLATLSACLALVFGGFGVAGCGDDDGEGVAEDAGQGLEEAGEDAGAAAEDAGDDLDEAAEDEGEDSE